MIENEGGEMQREKNTDMKMKIERVGVSGREEREGEEKEEPSALTR